MAVMKKAMTMLAPVAALLMACDDGSVTDPVYVDDSKTFAVEVRGTFHGLDQWGGGLSLALAGYDGESRYSTIQKNLPLTADKGVADTISLSKIPSSTKTIELAAANNLRQKVASLFSYEIPEDQHPDEVIEIDLGDIDASMFGAVDKAVFQGLSCARCHQGATPPAGLDLTTANAWAALVNHPSEKEPDQTLVKPGDAEASFLYKVITDGDDNVHYSHPGLFVEDDAKPLLTLIKAWIDEGAKN